MRKLKLLLAFLAFTGVFCGQLCAQEEGKYYFYNEDSGLFLSRGASWGTHASADTYGIAFELSKISDGVYTLKNVDHSKMANADKYLGDNLYTDNGTACNFTFTASSGKYKINKGTNDFLKIADADEYGQKPIETTTTEGDAALWTLMTVNEYNTFVSTRNDTYYSALATTMGFTGVTSQASMKSFVADAATVDYTSSVGNADIGGGSGAWTKTQTENNRGIGDSKAGDGVFQTWNGCVNVNQTVSDLPKGLYKITVEAFLRFGDKEAAKRVEDNGSMTSYVYGNNSKTLLHNFWSIRQDNDHPNSMAEAASQVINKDDRALLECYTYVGDDGELKLGIYLAGGFDAVWMICDNFTLTKISDTPSDEKKEELLGRVNEYLSALSESSFKTSLSTLKSTFESNPTLNNYHLLLDFATLAQEAVAAKALGMTDDVVNGYAATEDITSASAMASLQKLKVGEYTFITEKYTESATLGTWTENFAEDLNGEGYVADGEKYFNEWGTNTRTAKQTVSLPAGEYAISCIGRGAVGTSGYLYYKIGEADAVQVDFLMKGNRGRGVDTSGAANFSEEGTYNCDNNGFGWEYRFLTFNLMEETDVELGVSATFAGNWVSIYKPQLLTTETSIKTVLLTQISSTIEKVPTGAMNSAVKSTLDSKKSAANSASAGNTIEQLSTILTELNEAITAAEASVAEYEKISAYLAKAKAAFSGDYSAIESAISSGSYENSTDGCSAVKARRLAVATNGMSAGKDLTGLIDNNSFETGTTDYWTNTPSDDTGARSVTVDNNKYAMSSSDGDYLFNNWWKGTPLTQNIGTLPAGAYELQGVVASDGGTVYITMNDKHEAFVETANATGVGIEFAYAFTLDAAQEVTIGVVGGANGTKGHHKDYQEDGYWFYKADNFRLKYLGSTVPENTIDGIYFLSSNGLRISRGGDSGTEAELDEAGIPVKITTDKAGISKLQMMDTEKYLFWNNEMVYTDGTIEPNKTHHQPYWKVIPVSGGYKIKNTESGLYLSTNTNVEREDINYEIEQGVATCTTTETVWTLTNAEVDVEKIKLKKALDDAPATPTANIGDAAFQMPQSDVNALKSVRDAAQAVYDNPSATKSQVQQAITNVEALQPLTLNAPSSNQLFTISLANGKWASHGVNYENEAMTYLAGDRGDDQGGYNIKYQAPANKNLAQAFTFTKVEGNNYKLSQIDADGNVRYMCTAQAYGGSAPYIRTTTEADQAMLVTVIPTQEAGIYNLRNVAANEFIGAQDAGVFTVNSHIKFNIVETTKPSIAINTTDAGYGTTMLPFAVAALPSGVKAYTCAEVEGTTLTLAEVTALAANKPYIIEGAWNETVTGDAQGTALTYTEGLLTGVYADTAAPIGSYVLQNLNEVVGFYKVAEGKQPTVGANHAYLTTTSGARALFFDNATAIRAIEALTSGEAEIYNAAGARQNSLQKGVNIIKQGNKKFKVMVK
jgi:hypothetical protein